MTHILPLEITFSGLLFFVILASVLYDMGCKVCIEEMTGLNAKNKCCVQLIPSSYMIFCSRG